MRDARREVSRQRDRLNDTFDRIKYIDENAAEARADFAKYLCVRVSGYLETSISGLLNAYAAGRSSPPVSRYIAAELRWFQNAKKERVLTLFGQFDKSWRQELDTYLVDERSDAMGTIVAHRHKIAHGEDSDLSYVGVRAHWRVIQQIVDHIADLLDPPQV